VLVRRRNRRNCAPFIAVGVAVPASPGESHKRARHRGVVEVVLIHQETPEDDLIGADRPANNLVDREADSRLRQEMLVVLFVPNAVICDGGGADDSVCGSNKLGRRR
jgi:hypothetical protein